MRNLRRYSSMLGIASLSLAHLANAFLHSPFPTSAHQCLIAPRSLFAFNIDKGEKKSSNPKEMKDLTRIKKGEQKLDWIREQIENDEEGFAGITSIKKEVEDNLTLNKNNRTIIQNVAIVAATVAATTTTITFSADTNQTMVSTSKENGKGIKQNLPIGSHNSTTIAAASRIIKGKENIEQSSSSRKDTGEKQSEKNLVEKNKENDKEEKKSLSVSNNGIGGKGGFSYDVTKLKKNLVQQAVADCKEQLWDLLEGPKTISDSRRRRTKRDEEEESVSAMIQRRHQEQQEAIEEKFAALCQANPVYTTTDSYLLEGKWTFVFSSKKPARVLMDPDRFESKYETEVPGDIVGDTGPGSRHFFLESLSADQDPYVLDKSRFYGFLERERIYDVTSLARTSLELDLSQCTWRLGLVPIWRKKSKKIPTEPTTSMNIKILYVDSDLCISTEENMENPFTIYTKSDAWTARTQKLKGKWKSLRSRVRERLQPRLRRWTSKVRNSLSTKNDDDDVAPIGRVQNNMTSILIGLGDLDNNDNAAWEGEMDPFVNLSPRERQEILKSLQVDEIEAMGEKQKLLAEKLHQQKKFEFTRKKTSNKNKAKSHRKKKESSEDDQNIPNFLQTDDNESSSEYSMKLQREKPFNQPE